MNPHLSMGPGREFDVIRALLAQWGDAAVGVGDDAAVLDVPAGSRLVVSTDTSLEEVHFRRLWLSAEEIAWRAVQAAASDLAAMGATPLGMVIAITIPDAWRSELSALGAGIAEAARATALPIVGGDTTRGAQLALTVTVLGHATQPLSRCGARAGDTLYVTGQLGGPAAALSALRGGSPVAAAHRARFARPEARLHAGEWLAAQGASAAIDISDGLAGDAAHLAAASDVHAVLQLESIPCMEGIAPLVALASGEEYELLIAASRIDVAAFTRATGLSLTAVGHLDAAVHEAGGTVRVLHHGVPVSRPTTFDHFAQ
jgi:thiamine-monophosphate kinase